MTYACKFDHECNNAKDTHKMFQLGSGVRGFGTKPNTSDPHDVGQPSAAPRPMVATASGGHQQVEIHPVVR